jgi:hypothetical protein
VRFGTTVEPYGWCDTAWVEAGLPTFFWTRAPAGLLTRRQLREIDMAPGGQPPVAAIRRRPGGRLVAYLYRLDRAAERRRPTPAQLAAVAKALAARRVCPTCNVDQGFCLPRSLGQCWPCHRDQHDRVEAAAVAADARLHSHQSTACLGNDVAGGRRATAAERSGPPEPGASPGTGEPAATAVARGGRYGEVSDGPEPGPSERSDDTAEALRSTRASLAELVQQRVAQSHHAPGEARADRLARWHADDRCAQDAAGRHAACEVA